MLVFGEALQHGARRIQRGLQQGRATKTGSADGERHRLSGFQDSRFWIPAGPAVGSSRCGECVVAGRPLPTRAARESALSHSHSRVSGSVAAERSLRLVTWHDGRRIINGCLSKNCHDSGNAQLTCAIQAWSFFCVTRFDDRLMERLWLRMEVAVWWLEPRKTPRSMFVPRATAKPKPDMGLSQVSRGPANLIGSRCERRRAGSSTIHHWRPPSLLYQQRDCKRV